MWYIRKPCCSKLLAVVIFVALCYRVTAEGRLDMAPDAVDDLYTGCHDKAVKEFIDSGMLQKELSGRIEFEVRLTTECLTKIPGGQKDHITALLTYALAGQKARKTFNDEVKTMGVNVSTYQDDFHFKSLHFLLMDSIRLMNPGVCKDVYHVSNMPYKAQNGSKVRFGTFMEVQTDLSFMEDVSEGVLFLINTCFFANLEGFCGMTDKAVLSPTEEFTVEDIKVNEDYTTITLKHSKLEASHNCLLFSRSPGDVSTQWLLLVFVALSLYFCNC